MGIPQNCMLAHVLIITICGFAYDYVTLIGPILKEK
jgi:hypothetical protein